LATCDKKNPSTGFTLIEVLVSITLMAMISVAVLSALRSGALAWDKGTAKIEDLRRTRVVSDILDDQIRGSLPLFYNFHTEERVITLLGFEGTSTNLRFVSRSSFNDGPDGIPRWVDVKWTRDPQNSSGELIVEERRILPPDNLPESTASWHGAALRADSCSFEFLAPYQPNENAKWVQEWHSPPQQTLPRAVRMSCTSKGKTMRSLLPLNYADSSVAGLLLR
jgi:prepilin-type N-terminal cleavage/methylation domain-containing protein